MTRISVEQSQPGVSELLQQLAAADEPIVFEENGKVVAALVRIGDSTESGSLGQAVDGHRRPERFRAFGFARIGAETGIEKTAVEQDGICHCIRGVSGFTSPRCGHHYGGIGQ